MSTISDRTLAEHLTKRLRGVRAFQVFLRRLGPGDVVYASAWAWSPDGKVVEVKASAIDAEEAVIQLFRNLDQATAPEEP